MRIQLDKALPSVSSLVAIVAGLLLASTAIVSLGVIAMSPAALPQAAPEPLATRRCPECGWIESKREIAGGTDNRSIRIKEYTVRMVDGSSRTFTGGAAERWQLGERLKFIDGDG